MVNKRVRNTVLGCNLKNNRMISVCFQGKSFNITFTNPAKDLTTLVPDSRKGSLSAHPAAHRSPLPNIPFQPCRNPSCPTLLKLRVQAFHRGAQHRFSQSPQTLRSQMTISGPLGPTLLLGCAHTPPAESRMGAVPVPQALTLRSGKGRVG